MYSNELFYVQAWTIVCTVMDYRMYRHGPLYVQATNESYLIKLHKDYE